jgi:1,4-dihydroxy-2-naphthoyl-CoA hydrolase
MFSLADHRGAPPLPTRPRRLAGGCQDDLIPEIEDFSAFVAAAGLRLTHSAGDRVEGVIDLGPEHHTPWGVVHGGVYTTAIETAASLGASLAVGDRGQFAVGVNNTTDFVRSMTAGRVMVTATAVQQGRTQQLWEARIVDGSDRLVARGTVRLQNVDLRS